MKIPEVDPTGCDLVFWQDDTEVYFVEVRNGAVRVVLADQLAQLITALPEHLTLGIVMPNGALTLVRAPLQ